MRIESMSVPVRGRREKRKEGGFTLLELLISMTLFAVIMVILGGALRLGFRAVSAGEARTETLERFRTSWAIVTAQLQSAVPMSYLEDGARKFYVKGDDKTLQFATSRSLWGGVKGAVIVSYRIETGEDGKQMLYASEQSFAAEDVREVKLFDDLKTLSFSYFGRDATDEEGKWTDAWSDETKYPEQIQAALSRDRWEGRILVPLYARVMK